MGIVLNHCICSNLSNNKIYTLGIQGMIAGPLEGTRTGDQKMLKRQASCPSVSHLCPSLHISFIFLLCRLIAFSCPCEGMRCPVCRLQSTLPCRDVSATPLSQFWILKERDGFVQLQLNMDLRSNQLWKVGLMRYKYDLQKRALLCRRGVLFPENGSHCELSGQSQIIHGSWSLLLICLWFTALSQWALTICCPSFSSFSTTAILGPHLSLPYDLLSGNPRNSLRDTLIGHQFWVRLFAECWGRGMIKATWTSSLTSSHSGGEVDHFGVIY